MKIIHYSNMSYKRKLKRDSQSSIISNSTPYKKSPVINRLMNSNIKAKSYDRNQLNSLRSILRSVNSESEKSDSPRQFLQNDARMSRLLEQKSILYKS